MKIYQSAQDYLETILILSKQMPNVRSIDIANYMKLTKQSVHRAVKNFHSNQLIDINEKGYITLTDEGLKLATEIYEKHTCITQFLIKLGVNEETALEDACKLEHDISEETFNAIKDFMNK